MDGQVNKEMFVFSLVSILRQYLKRKDNNRILSISPVQLKHVISLDLRYYKSLLEDNNEHILLANKKKSMNDVHVHF